MIKVRTMFIQNCTSDLRGRIASRFMPSGPMTPGYLQLRFPTHPPPTSHIPLSLLRPSHFPLAVIGVASCQYNDSLESISRSFDALESDLFPSGSQYPLVKHLFVFEEGDTSSSSHLMQSLPSVSVIPSLMGNKNLYIGTLLGDVCSQILKALGILVRNFYTLLSNCSLTQP